MTKILASQIPEGVCLALLGSIDSYYLAERRQQSLYRADSSRKRKRSDKRQTNSHTDTSSLSQILGRSELFSTQEKEKPTKE
jgi:hypothetical protein